MKMLRPSRSHLLTLIVPAMILCSATKVSAQASWRLYDVRDLIGLIPPTAPETPASDASSDAGMAMLGLRTLTPVHDPIERWDDNVDELMDRICDAFGVAHSTLLTGVYGVEADDEQHAKIQALLTQVRDLYAECYEVELVWFTTSPSVAPSIGSAIALPGDFHRHHLVVARRTPTPVRLATRQSYISDLAAVVATNASAYDPVPKSIEDWLSLSVLVGAQRESENAAAFRLTGELRQVTMGKMAAPMVFQEVTTTAIELPTVAMRSIQASLPVEYGQMTVVSVLDGFREAECVVIAASIRKLAQP